MNVAERTWYGWCKEVGLEGSVHSLVKKGGGGAGETVKETGSEKGSHSRQPMTVRGKK